ncbi:MAG: hypothetical protein IMF07_02795 [Proteobacteria bacterium]|nr:hypothetical protein [Pseudomonadota bacterium]
MLTNKVFIKLCLLLIAAILCMACAAKRPVMYPNDHLSKVGSEAAEKDIEECIKFAKESGVESERAEEVAGKTATGSAIGAVTGLAVGAVFGGSGRSAAAGALGGGTGGFMSGIFSSRDPDPLLKRFVERCLRERGYEPVGWR